MRYGWLATLAAIIIAAPASAANWVQYTFSGVGMQYIGDYSGNYTSARGIVTGQLIVNSDPFDPGLYAWGDGASFRFFDGATLLEANGTAGSIGATLQCFNRGCQGAGVVALRFPGDTMTPGFTTMTPSSVTGTFNLSTGTLSTTTDYEAAITRLSVESLPDGYATFSTVSFVALPVPEPATWAMMITGFGAAGAQLRRRRGMNAVRFTT